MIVQREWGIADLIAQGLWNIYGNSLEGHVSQAVILFPHGFILQGYKASFTKANPSDLKRIQTEKLFKFGYETAFWS